MPEKILTFTLNGQEYGIAVAEIKEMIRSVDYTVVPNTSEEIAGFFNLRGQIVTLFDLGVLLGQTKRRRGIGESAIILKKPLDPDMRGFIVDLPGDVIDREDSKSIQVVDFEDLFSEISR